MVAAITGVLSRVSEVNTDTEPFKLLVTFSLTGLLVSAVAACYGLDTSGAFF